MTETISTKQLAAILGISVQRVNQLGSKGKIKREADGQWNLVRVNQDLRQNLDRRQTLKALGQQRQSEDGMSANADNTFSEAQRRREWIRVQREEMELRQRKGELAELSEVEQMIGSIVAPAQSRLLGLAGKLGPKLAGISDPRECSAIIEREIKEVLNTLVEFKLNAAA
jgi:hypothetical protein